MKKRWLIFGLTAMLSLGCLFACDNGNGDDNGDGTGTEQGGDTVNTSTLEGTYMLETIREGDEVYSVGDTYDGGVLTADTLIVALKEGGTAYVGGFGAIMQGTWVKTANGVNILINGETNVLTWEEGKLTFNMSDGYGWTVVKTSNTVNPEDFIAEGGNANGGVSGEVNLSVLVGTYKFEQMIDGGTTYIVGQSYRGTLLTEDYVTIALREDGTAYVSMVGEEDSTGTWMLKENEVVIEANGKVETFAWENGKIVSCNEPFVTCGKVSDTVNPDDFNVGGNGDNNQGEGGSTNKPESGDNERPGGDNPGDGVSDAFLLGTYKFYSMTISGETTSVENGISEDYISVGINPDHTMYYSIMNNEALILDWELVGDEIQCFTGNTLMMTFEIVGAELVVRTGNDIMTLVKKSDTVNPNDFNLGESGDNQGGGTNNPESGESGTGGRVDIAVLEGTYHFEQLEYGGKTYKAGESFYGTALTTNFLVIALEEDGTAYVRSSGDESKGTWQWEEDRLLVDSNNEEMYYKWENGKLISTKAPIMTVGKTSNDVNPDDFGFGESGTDSDNTDSDAGEEEIVQADIVGVYNFYRLDMYQGETYYVGDYFSNMNRLTDTYYYYDLKADGSAIVIWQDGGFDGCTWSWDGEYVSIKLESGYELAKMTFDGEYLYEVQDFSYKTWIKKTA